MTAPAPFPPSAPSWSILEDADQDGIRDADELLLKLNPMNPFDGMSDEGGDGLPLAWEIYLGTNPNLADTDGDGYSDSEEVLIFKAGERGSSK